MSEETLRVLITSGTTIFVAFMSNILVYAISKLNNKNQNDKSILEEQYKQIFAPIHKILFYDISDGKSIQYSKIDEILSEHYFLIPKSILESFSNINEIKDDMEQFEYNIKICFRYLSSILGYSKENLSGYDKKEAKKILSSKSFDYIFSKMLTYFIIGSVVISSVINILYVDYADTTKFIVSIVGYAFLIFMDITMIYLVSLFILKVLFPFIVAKIRELYKNKKRIKSKHKK
ncbi:MAG: hypothetical protein J1E05_08025 [Eubacterium sp.]|nr:hypothetical protein [Eubacterium sp.]